MRIDLLQLRRNGDDEVAKDKNYTIEPFRRTYFFRWIRKKEKTKKQKNIEN